MVRTLDKLVRGKINRLSIPRAGIYAHLPSAKDLEERGIFDTEGCKRIFRALLWYGQYHGFYCEVISFDHSEYCNPGQSLSLVKLNKVHTDAMRRGSIKEGEYIMFYEGKKNEKKAVYAERFGYDNGVTLAELLKNKKISRLVLT